ncbi:phosphatidate cytidylyltransferase [Candidatus Pelagibacter sp.]|uniref:phosphatidate cytidylyltransferase n=1 Tax=Candidatus Pelagibacter sp. TaxID=2024849 RepID=UPI003F835D03|tara:strand:+ start:515 stop:1150 length:636 start_codon:yes stop_codon:yes gene_type:complete
MINKELQKRILSSLILIPLSFFFIIQGHILFIFFLSIIFLVSSYEWIIMSKKSLLLKFLGIIFLFFSFYTAFYFRENENYKNFLFIITICIFTDIGGYSFGKMFKGPKLTKISPKKTYAGVFGSFLLPLIVGLVVYEYEYTDQISDKGLYFLIIILFISFISQIGDLIISYFKRNAKLKDTGKILPGHGGLLDRIDGIIFVFPFCYLITIL